ncbi:MAG: cytochrome c3 family protein [Gallionellaceae bacterium]|nr:cytochrome c3 family protein [Gallionellaceae bacterium]
MKYAFNLRWFIALLLLLTLGAAAWLHAKSQPGMHPLNTDCANCHLAGANTDASSAGTLIASQEKLCSGCHKDALEVSHVTGFTPPAQYKIPAAYPLDWKGDLTCSTCHDIHSMRPGKLRGSARGQQLCMACHTEAFFDNMADGGVSIMQSGHTGAAIARNWDNLDQYSLQCLNCHSENGEVYVDTNQIVRHDLNHPIGRNYAAAMAAGGYKPANQLSRKILLPSGMISCVSCHESYSKNHGKLVMATTNSTLCFECHEL